MGILRASVRYVMSMLKREKQAALFGTITIMFIVIISSFICVFWQNSQSLFYVMGKTSTGDIDILLTSQRKLVLGGPNNQTLLSVSKNNYLEETALNMYDQSPFGFIPKPNKTVTKDEAIKKSEMSNTVEVPMFPVVNTTMMEGVFD